MLGAGAKGDDPLEGARVAGQAAKSDIVSETQTIRIGHLPAAHTRIHADGKIMMDLTWIAHRGFVYQIAGLASTKRFEALESTFAAVAQSFSQAERSGINEERIRLVKARAGETVAALAVRSNSIWTKDEVLVANGLASDATLNEGQVFKIAVLEPYISSPRP
ncbi:hypothetical protein [Nitrospira sp. Nam80]